MVPKGKSGVLRAAVATATVLFTTVVALSGTSGASAPRAKAFVIGVSNGYYGNAARQQYEAELKAYAALPMVKPMIKGLDINNAGTSVATQISAVDTMIAQKVNAIVLDSNDPTALNPAIAAAHKAGIPVVAVNDIVTSSLAYHVETVGKRFGATMAEGFVNLIHKKGNIIVLHGIKGNAVDNAEASGFNSVFAQFPKVHVYKVLYPQWDDGQAQQQMLTLLNNPSTPKIAGVFTEGGMEQGVVQAYRLSHHPYVPVSGTDENGFACQLKYVPLAGSYRSPGRHGDLGLRTCAEDGAGDPLRQGRAAQHPHPLDQVEHVPVDRPLLAEAPDGAVPAGGEPEAGNHAHSFRGGRTTPPLTSTQADPVQRGGSRRAARGCPPARPSSGP